jgi:UDP:flavonoid glycosyltransferase YjiC (YdhE family)
MRVLITTSPGIGHLYPVISTAWALRAAGHDVILATGGHQELAANAGLQVVDTAPGVDFGSVFRGFFAARGNSPTDSVDADFAAELFAVVSARCTDGTVELVRRWRPDLVLYTPLHAVGAMAARIADVPSVSHTIGIDQQAGAWARRLAKAFAAEYERIGVEPVEPTAVLDVSPPSLRGPDEAGWSMRYVPFNGGAVLPSWVLADRERPMVTVTLGSVVPFMAGIGALKPLVAGAAGIDADFVITLGGAKREDFGPLPDNVRLVDWIPLSALLARSAAVIHHGGAGTTLTALDAGLPQLVLPHGADQYKNAEVIAKSGAGAIVQPAELDADRIGELLADAPMRAVAEAIAAEMAAQPTPVDLVPRIIALAS